jgi:hypothetical protein
LRAAKVRVIGFELISDLAQPLVLQRETQHRRDGGEQLSLVGERRVEHDRSQGHFLATSVTIRAYGLQEPDRGARIRPPRAERVGTQQLE